MSKRKTTKTKPEIRDFNRAVEQLLAQYRGAGCCPGCLAKALFINAIEMVTTAGGICWPKSHSEEIELIEALTQRVALRAAELGGVSSGGTLQ